MDSYAPCPCGSGKKIKFCCQAILPEMAKIQRFQENNQPMMALQAIDKLLKTHPDNGWLITQRAMTLLGEDRPEEARDSLLPFLRKNPDHPLANGLLAGSVMQAEGYPASKKVTHRAFLKSSSHEPHIVGMLAGSVAAYHIHQNNLMAARQNMALVLRYSRDEERQRTLMAMLEMESDTDVPYPLREGHPLPELDAGDELLPTYRKAQKLATLGCFEEAADLLQAATEKGESAKLLHAIGLLRAWDGDEVRAAQALHRAGSLYSDFARAVEVETIAQLLDNEEEANVVKSTFRVYTTDSLSRLLTRLDNEDRMARIPTTDKEEAGVAAVYEVLDRPQLTESELDSMMLDQLPEVVGQLTLTDRSESTPARVVITSLAGKDFDSVLSVFLRVAGELVQHDETQSPESNPELVSYYNRDELALSRTSYFPPKTSVAVRQRLNREFVQKCIDHIWLDSPLQSLGGRSPREASADPAEKVRVAAALRVFDCVMDRRSMILNHGPLEQALGISAANPSLPPNEQLNLNSMSVCDIQSIELASLTDEQFHRLMQRTQVIKHAGLSYKVWRHFLEQRPQLCETYGQEMMRAYSQLAEICAQSFLNEESIAWIEKAFQYSCQQKMSFETQLLWKMRELTYRARNPDDLKFKTLLLELWNHYGAKLPSIRNSLQEFVTTLRIDPPWDNAIVTAQSLGTGTVWTAETEQTVSSEKKLWLPD